MFVNLKNLDYISVQTDVNCTLTFGDSTKTVNPIISEIAGLVIFKWDQNLPAMSYKDWIQKICYPGDKYNPEVKEKQEEAIGNFFVKFQEKLDSLKNNDTKENYQNASKLYEEHWNLYQSLATKYENPETKKVQLNIFPSFIKMIDALKKISSCTISLRTFGPDGPEISNECLKENLTFNTIADFTQEGMRISGQNDLLANESLFETLLKTNVLGQDQFKEWSKGNYKAIHGKKMYCVNDGIFHNKNVLTIALDDNLSDTLKKESADPDAKNIAFPMDIYGRETSWQSEGIIGIKVDTIEAALDENYFINELNKELKKRNYNLLT